MYIIDSIKKESNKLMGKTRKVTTGLGAISGL
jgi:hypothetical protein